ncbi:18 kDa heat shock protein [Clostridium polyendosporum]|uniref:18 kDa heat shock protein n=1 Tax=Clostridium polyendosporum TaxID=69208 RepID=A0A919VFY8_9CLOT|nr:Hsp20/alpha crystallin family protein [Clostridium polyendosporum]GIM28905.1 18 kDa heat shock protein [Clostridium polyendosporum]
MFRIVPYNKRSNGLLTHSFDDLFGNFFDVNFADSIRNGSDFRVDMKETDNSYLVEADLPGVEKGSIDIDYANNYLTIKAVRKSESENTTDNFIRQERLYGEFRRSFYVDNIDEFNIKAAFNNGVLSITLPKKHTGAYKKKIDIH